MKHKVRAQLSPTSDVIMLAREMTLESDWSNVSASYLNRMLALGKMKPPLIQPARSTSTAPIQVALLNKYDYQTSQRGLSRGEFKAAKRALPHYESPSFQIMQQGGRWPPFYLELKLH